MTETTLNGITALMTADPTITLEQKDAILRACRTSTPKRNMINAKDAMEILGVSRPTLREYVKNGQVEQINLSKRKIRFDADSVNRLAYLGVPKSNVQLKVEK